jgi:DNA modification methylase
MSGPMPRYTATLVDLYLGECVEVMAAMPEASVDAIVTDPPYGLEFMGKEWDRLVSRDPRSRGADGVSWPLGLESKIPSRTPRFYRMTSQDIADHYAWHLTWTCAALRVLKPGAHLLAFGGTRTHHRLMVALEDAGFEIRDCLMWLYGSGFPKSLDVSKAIDKECAITAPATDAARQWAGWGTALKPAWEPIILARKPLAEANVAANVLTYGTGGINVDGGRIEGAPPQVTGRGWSGARGYGHDEPPIVEAQRTASGRWPANLVLDEEAARQLDAQSGESASRASDYNWTPSNNNNPAHKVNNIKSGVYFADQGGASRFFYTAKADREDRDGATHPTVKPLDLMAWLIKLITPPQGVVLDPFAGSGATIAAARDLGIRSIGIERESAYLDMAIYRLRQEVLGL